MTRPETYSDRDVLIGVVVAGVFVFVISGLVGHFGAPSGSRWELTSILGTALGTTLLAGATGFLAYSTRSDVRATVRLANISQAALDAQVQPVLVDVVLGSGPVGATDFVAYEPGVADGSRVIAHEVVEVSALGSGHFVCSVPLRNAGAGLAVITEEPRLDHPSRDVDYIGRLTTQIVPRGEQTRAYFGPGVPLETPEDATLIVKVPYTDASGSTDASSSRVVWTEGKIAKRDNVWKVIQVAIRRDGEDEPFVISAAAV
jgi:hypothetical protein